MYRLLLLLLAILFGCTPSAGPPDVATPKKTTLTPPLRIISTLPSITEVLFDIGLGDRIVGDSPFTKYPPEAANIDKIGGLYDVNHEKIISLKPDLVILSAENVALRQSLSTPVLIVDHRTLDGVLDSYLVIGEVFGEDILAIAQQKRQELIDKLNAFEARAKGKKPVRTLISIDRSAGTEQIQNMFVAGADSFLSVAVSKAGGENVAASLGLLSPSLSAEGIIHLAPDVIIDLRVNRTDAEQSVADWYSLGDAVPAVKHRRILTLTDDFASIPGSRTPMLIEKIARYFDALNL
jgi:iron complex transport system substrate-binding protein